MIPELVAPVASEVDGRTEDEELNVDLTEEVKDSR